MAEHHTPGRLQPDAYEDLSSIIGSIDGRRYAVACMIRNDADARRLAACWNACEGVPTELLKAHPAPFSELRAERDELLKALQLAVRQNEHDMLMTGEELRAAQALIEKHQPQAGTGPATTL